MKIASIVGARPQFIKYFPVSMAIKKLIESGEIIEDILIHTGQHYDYEMSEIFFRELGIKSPDYHLGIGSGTHSFQTGQILQRLEKVLEKESPDVVVVYGDTNSTLGGALAAAKIHIPVVHVEAGLRSYNKYMPEEINRVLTDHVSSLLLCPTEIAVENLKREGFSNIGNNGKLLRDEFDLSKYHADIFRPLVFNIGDVMYDVLKFAIRITEQKSNILKSLNLDGRDYDILTIHRAGNTDDAKKLDEILEFINENSHGKTIIFPVHPRTRGIIQTMQKTLAPNIKMIEPLGYFDILFLVKNSDIVFTDSGGLQKEAYWLNIPCVTLRDETEWLETVKSGWNVLYRDYKGFHKSATNETFLYGDGKAAERIIRVLKIIGHQE